MGVAPTRQSKRQERTITVKDADWKGLRACSADLNV
jgi:hypothetical protein